MPAGDRLDRVLAGIDPRLCVQCKAARGLCGIDPCPLLQKIAHQMPRVVREHGKLGRDLFGSSPPSLFVGRHGYPNVTVGPMLPPEHREEADARLLDSPREWLAMTIPDVVGLRSSLMRTTHKTPVFAPRDPNDAFASDRITRLSQELALAARPVDTEVRVTRSPVFGMPTVGEFTAPHGPTVTVERAQLTENVRVERPVERVANDTDLRAGAALVDLYTGGTDLYQLERILSAGMVGLGRNRKLVPTRWSITATDDTLGKALIPTVLQLPTIDKPVVHFGERFGNRFHVMLLPRVWGFDSIEAWMKGNFWMSGRPQAPQVVAEEDWEDHTGRTTYASTAGGYYATRLSVLERMVATGRQAFALVLREITDDYTTPLGVWVVREVCKLAMESRPLVFEDTESAMRHIDRRALHKPWRSDARLLGDVLQQKTLDSF